MSFDQHAYVMGMVAAIIERGDDQLRDRTPSDAKWVIDLLLGQLGYKMHITEDGDVEFWPADASTMEPGDGPITAANYRFGEIDGKWYHTEEAYRAAAKEHADLVDAMNTLDGMVQR